LDGTRQLLGRKPGSKDKMKKPLRTYFFMFESGLRVAKKCYAGFGLIDRFGQNPRSGERGR
jgi:hypothetical protein